MTGPLPSAVLTVVTARIADLHEQHGPTCLVAPDGQVCCSEPATHRATFAPLPGFDGGPVTFTCAEHEPLVGRMVGVDVREVRT